jgi:AcrR family transcriptional regulator
MIEWVMAIRPRREEYSEATRRALLASAASLFVAKGYAATSLDEVAAEARVTKGAVYHHFATKQALFEAVADEAEQAASEAIIAVAAQHESVWDGAVAGLDAFLDQCLDPAYSRLCFQDGPAVMGFAAWWEHGERHQIGLIQAMLASLHAEGLVAVDDIRMLATLLFGSITAGALALARAADPAAERGRARAILVRLMEGLRPAGTPPT